MSRNGRKGGVIASVILAVLLAGFLGIVLMVSTGLYIAHHVRVSGRSLRGDTTVETPFGSVHVRNHGRLDPKQMGVPIYPGAVRCESSRKLASFDFDFGDVHKAFAVSAAAYRTSDSVEQVTDFYRDQLPHWLVSQKGDGYMRLSFTKGGYKRFVAIYEDDGETRIALASVGEPASN